MLYMAEGYLPFNKKYGNANNNLQLTEIDVPLRNGIHNIFFHKFFRLAEADSLGLSKDGRFVNQMFLAIWLHVLHLKISSNLNALKIIPSIKYYIESAAWDNVYFLIEYVIRYFQKKNLSTKELETLFNKEFEQHNSAYRIVGNVIAPVIDPIHMDAITLVLVESEKRNYKGLNNHLNDALDFLSHRPIPKPTSSIKQSIDAVEWVIRKITNESTFGNAIRELKKLKIAPDKILDAASDLYDFTNSKEGIRHAQIKDETIVTLEEAKLYLVSCSAICSYLLNICNKNGILIK